MFNQNIMNIEMKADIFCDEHNFKWEKNIYQQKRFKKEECFFPTNLLKKRDVVNVKAEEKKHKNSPTSIHERGDYFSSL